MYITVINLINCISWWALQFMWYDYKTFAAPGRSSSDIMKNFLNSNSSSGSTSDTSNESPCARITPTPPKGGPDSRNKAMEDPHMMGRPRSMSTGNQKSPGSPYPQVPPSHNGGSMPHREVSSSGHPSMPPHLEREPRRQGGQHTNPITDYWKRHRAHQVS